MLAKYVSNWYSILAVYAGIISQASAKFKDGKHVIVSRKNYDSFQEALYRRHCSNHGFIYNLNSRGQIVVSTTNGLRLIIPDEKCSFFLDEIFIMKVYGEPLIDGRPVIDIGATIGDSSIYFASLGAEVYAFEPNPEYYRLLLMNIKLNGFEDRIHAFNEAVSGGSGHTSLENILLENSLSNVFLKLDCEGCEYDVILNTKETAFERVNDIVLEYHQNPHIIQKQLRDLGFKVKLNKEIISGTRS